MKFFVAKVNLGEQARLGLTSCAAPDGLRVAEVHAADPARHGERGGTQELFVFTLTRKGRVETTNYRTVKLPSDVEVPLFVKPRVRPTSTATMFDQHVKSER